MDPIEHKQAAWPFQPIIPAYYTVVRSPPQKPDPLANVYAYFRQRRRRRTPPRYSALLAGLVVRVLFGISPVIAAMWALVALGILPR